MLVRLITRKTYKTQVPRPESGNRVHAQLCYTPAAYPILLLPFFGCLARLIELSPILVYLVPFGSSKLPYMRLASALSTTITPFKVRSKRVRALSTCTLHRCPKPFNQSRFV